MKFDLSLGKILLGFVEISVSVCAYRIYYSKKNEKSPNSDKEDIVLTYSEQFFFFLKIKS